MDNLSTVPSTGTFGQVVNVINQNFGKTDLAINQAEVNISNLQDKAYKDVGYFASSTALTTAYPTPTVGMYAGVWNSTKSAYEIWRCNTAGTWTNTEEADTRGLVLDNALDPTSDNPVKNKAVTNEIYLGGVYDVTAHNSGATFASLSALLSDANLSTYIPTAVRKGGMSIKFVQSSGNRYAQCRYMSTSTANTDFTNIANWQVVDIVPTKDSKGLVESGGVYNRIHKIEDLHNPTLLISGTYHIESGDSRKLITGVTALQNAEKGYLVIKGVTPSSVVFTNSSWSLLLTVTDITEGEPKDFTIPKNAVNIAVYVDSAVSARTSFNFEIYYDSAENRIATLEDTVLKKVEQQLSSDEIRAVYNNLALFDEIPTSLINKSGWNPAGTTNITFDYDNAFEEGVAKLDITGVTPNKIAFKNENGVILSETSDLYCIIPNGTKKITIYWSTPIGTAGQVNLRIYQYGSAIIANYLLKNKIPAIESNTYNRLTNLISLIDYMPTITETTLDLTSIEKIRGSVDYNNGEIITHAQRLVSNIIPIKELNEIHTVCNATDASNYYRIGVYFYNVDRFTGEASYITDTWYLTVYGQRNNRYIVPMGANGVRFMFSKFSSGSETTINSYEINSSNYSITSVFTEVFEDIDTKLITINKNEDVRINDYSKFIQGINSRTLNVWSAATTLIKPIKVEAGEKYAVFVNDNELIYTYRILFYNNPNSDPVDYVTLGVQTASEISGSYFSLVEIPVGVQYIRITALGGYGSLDITPAQAILGDFHVINITKDKLIWGNKFVSYIKSSSRYAQGLAIQKGYGFLAFSDGTIDVYNINTGTLIQGNIIVPAPTGMHAHLNSINFMHSKYDESDEFTILMCQPTNPTEHHFGLRIALSNNTFSFTKVCDFEGPNFDESEFEWGQVFFDDKLKIAYQQNIKAGSEYSGGLGEMVFKKYTYTGVLTGQPVFTEVSANEFSYPGIFPEQGGRVVNGRLYLVFGTDNKSAYILGFDMDKKKVVDAINLREDTIGLDYTIEPQSFDFSERGVVLASTYGMWLLHI